MRQMKDSGIQWIGEIPEDWDLTSLKRGCGISSGEYISKENYVDDGKFSVIGSNGEIGKTNDSNNEDEVITTGRVGTIGTTHIVKRAWITDNVLIIKSNKLLLNKYIYYTVPCLDFNLMSSGTAQPLITATNLKNQLFPFPPYDQQLKSSTYLDQKVAQIDNIIEKTKESIEGYKKYKQSLITEVVTKGLDQSVKMKDSGIEWIGEVPEHWKVIKFKYLFEIVKRIAGETGYNVLSVTQNGLKIKDITSNEGQLSADYRKYQLVYEDDYVMNHMDLLTGWVDLSCFNGVTSPDYRVFRCKNTSDCYKEFYKLIFQMCYTNKIFYGLGQGVSNLGRWRLQTDKFINFTLPVPPYDEQIKISNYLSKKAADINSLIHQKEQLILELELYKKSLIYEVITGKKEII